MAANAWMVCLRCCACVLFSLNAGDWRFAVRWTHVLMRSRTHVPTYSTVNFEDLLRTALDDTLSGNLVTILKGAVQSLVVVT